MDGSPTERGTQYSGHVLGCVGASPWLESQVQTVLGFGQALNASITLLHVTIEGKSDSGVKERIHAEVEANSGSAEVVTVSSKAPDKAILQEVQRRNIDLVYAGAAPHEPMLVDIMGSTARRLARRARCSVLLDSLHNRESYTFSNAVVAMPLDESAQWLLRFTTRLAEAGVVGKIHAVHEILPAPRSAVHSNEAAWEISRTRAEAEFRELISGVDLRDQHVRSACVEGRDLSGVVSYADRAKADLVICQGPKRRIRTLGRLLGNEFENLLSDLPSALLLLQPGPLTREMTK